MVILVIPVFLSVLQVLCGLCEVWCCPEAAVPDAATPGCRSLCVTSWGLQASRGQQLKLVVWLCVYMCFLCLLLNVCTCAFVDFLCRFSFNCCQLSVC